MALEIVHTAPSLVFRVQAVLFSLIFFCRTMEQDTNIIPGKSWRRIKVRNLMMLMKKACNHPYLLEYPLIEGTDLLRIDEGTSYVRHQH